MKLLQSIKEMLSIHSKAKEEAIATTEYSAQNCKHVDTVHDCEMRSLTGTGCCMICGNMDCQNRCDYNCYRGDKNENE